MSREIKPQEPITSPEHWSKLIFGSKHRLSIWSALLEQEVESFEVIFEVRDIQRRIDESLSNTTYTAIYNELSVLQRLGMIERRGTVPTRAASGFGVDIVQYEKLDSPLWDMVGIAMNAFEGHLEDVQG